MLETILDGSSKIALQYFAIVINCLVRSYGSLNLNMQK